jgi:hypothetical protein
VNGRIRGPDVFEFELVVDFLFGEHDPRLADEWARQRTDEFHHILPLLKLAESIRALAGIGRFSVQRAWPGASPASRL